MNPGESRALDQEYRSFLAELGGGPLPPAPGGEGRGEQAQQAQQGGWAGRASGAVAAAAGTRRRQRWAAGAAGTAGAGAGVVAVLASGGVAEGIACGTCLVSGAGSKPWRSPVCALPQLCSGVCCDLHA